MTDYTTAQIDDATAWLKANHPRICNHKEAIRAVARLRAENAELRTEVEASRRLLADDERKRVATDRIAEENAKLREALVKTQELMFRADQSANQGSTSTVVDDRIGANQPLLRSALKPKEND